MKKLYKKISNYLFEEEMPVVFVIALIVSILSIIITELIA